MHFNLATVLIITTFCCSIYLLLNKSDRMFPTRAVIASGVELLLAFGVMSLTLAKFRIDVILPGVLLVAGALCWSKASSKSTITAATVVSLVAIIQLAGAIHLFR
jgi:hypothetical protein